MFSAKDQKINNSLPSTKANFSLLKQTKKPITNDQKESITIIAEKLPKLDSNSRNQLDLKDKKINNIQIKQEFINKKEEVTTSKKLLYHAPKIKSESEKLFKNFTKNFSLEENILKPLNVHHRNKFLSEDFIEVKTKKIDLQLKEDSISNIKNHSENSSIQSSSTMFKKKKLRELLKIEKNNKQKIKIKNIFKKNKLKNSSLLKKGSLLSQSKHSYEDRASKLNLTVDLGSNLLKYKKKFYNKQKKLISIATNSKVKHQFGSQVSNPVPSQNEMLKKYSTVSYNSTNSRQIPKVKNLEKAGRMFRKTDPVISRGYRIGEEKKEENQKKSSSRKKKSSFSPLKVNNKTILKNKSLLVKATKLSSLNNMVSNQIKKYKKVEAEKHVSRSVKINKKNSATPSKKVKKKSTTPKKQWIKQKSRTPTKTSKILKSPTPKKNIKNKLSDLKKKDFSEPIKNNLTKRASDKKAKRVVHQNTNKARSVKNKSLVKNRRQKQGPYREVKSIKPSRQISKTNKLISNKNEMKKAGAITLQALKQKNQLIKVTEKPKNATAYTPPTVRVKSKSRNRNFETIANRVKPSKSMSKKVDLSEKFSKTMDNCLPSGIGRNTRIVGKKSSFHQESNKVDVDNEKYMMGSTVSDNYHSISQEDMNSQFSNVNQLNLKEVKQNQRASHASNLIYPKDPQMFNVKGTLHHQQSTPQFKVLSEDHSKKQLVMSQSQVSAFQTKQNTIITKKARVLPKSLKTSEIYEDQYKLVPKSSAQYSAPKLVQLSRHKSSTLNTSNNNVKNQQIIYQPTNTMSSSVSYHEVKSDRKKPHNFTNIKPAKLSQSITISDHSGSQRLSSFENSGKKAKYDQNYDDFGNERVSVPVENFETETFIQTNEISRNSITLEESKDYKKNYEKDQLSKEFDHMVQSFTKAKTGPGSFGENKNIQTSSRIKIPSQNMPTSPINLTSNAYRFQQISKNNSIPKFVPGFYKNTPTTPTLQPSTSTQPNLFKKEKGVYKQEYKLVDSETNLDSLEYLPDNSKLLIPKESTQVIKKNPELSENMTFNKRTIIRKSGKKDEFLIMSKKPQKISIKAHQTREDRKMQPKIVKVSVTRKQQRLTADSKVSRNSKIAFGSYRNISKTATEQYYNQYTPKKPKYSIITKNYRDSANDTGYVSGTKTSKSTVINIKELPNAGGKISSFTKNIQPVQKVNSKASYENTPIKGLPSRENKKQIQSSKYIFFLHYVLISL